ncbi:hypothetical protein [Phocaeicola massiliensis]|uniref:hypothetical protein n=1 Tax=Phocaeicola massiliensis TaxID=204516 RepID=UPI0022E04C8D|nr:hypothetical protein [Phocaeicola massiliensis]
MHTSQRLDRAHQMGVTGSWKSMPMAAAILIPSAPYRGGGNEWCGRSGLFKF